MHKHSLTFSIPLVAAMCASTMCQAAPFVPSGLTPGSSYHLVFVTSSARDATSGQIGDYNTFVNNQAALNPTLTGTNTGVQYFAIASTTTVDANVNAAVTAPVYNFNGDKVADSYADLWDGTLDNAIQYDAFGNFASFPDIWTGTTTAGVGLAGSELGTASPHSGIAFAANSLWISDAVSPAATNMAMYGLSQELTVPVPEPSTWALAIVGGAAMLLVRRRI